MTEKQLREIIQRDQEFRQKCVKEFLKMGGSYPHTKHAALPGASLWTRLKVRFMNWRQK